MATNISLRMTSAFRARKPFQTTPAAFSVSRMISRRAASVGRPISSVGAGDDCPVESLREIRGSDEQDIPVIAGQPVHAREGRVRRAVHVNRVGLQAEMMTGNGERLQFIE